MTTRKLAVPIVYTIAFCVIHVVKGEGAWCRGLPRSIRSEFHWVTCRDNQPAIVCGVLGGFRKNIPIFHPSPEIYKFLARLGVNNVLRRDRSPRNCGASPP